MLWTTHKLKSWAAFTVIEKVGQAVLRLSIAIKIIWLSFAIFLSKYCELSLKIKLRSLEAKNARIHEPKNKYLIAGCSADADI